MNYDERALLDMVIAYPAEDLPRLVYADYLEETATKFSCDMCDATGVVDTGCGRTRACAVCVSGYVTDGRAERAEFIRIQCELASMGYPGPLSMSVARASMLAAKPLTVPDSPAALSDRSCAIFVEWGAAWGDVRSMTAWSRGFIDEVRCDYSWWYGMPCGRCSATGDAGIVKYNECPHCENGYVGRNGIRIAANHPVRRVVFPNSVVDQSGQAIDVARHTIARQLARGT